MKLYVEQLPDGRFKYLLRYLDPRTGKYRRVTTIKNTNSKQSYNAAMRELQDRIEGFLADGIPVQAAFNMYLKDKARTLKPQTLIRNSNEIKAVNQQLGNIALGDLTALRLRTAIAAVSPKNCTYNERLARYKAFLTWCFENDLVETDWWRKLKPLPDDQRARIQDKYLEPEELRKLLDGMKQPLWYYLTVFMVLSGLRIGEAIALNIDDVNEYIDVNKTFSLVTQKISTTKTLDSTRLVFVQPELRQVLERYRVFRLMYQPDSPLLFPGPDGGYASYAAYNKYLKNNSQRILGHTITTHALRHTSTSLFAAAGVDLDAISRRLGHANSQITQEIYLHITEAQRQKDNAAVSVNLL